MPRRSVDVIGSRKERSMGFMDDAKETAEAVGSTPGAVRVAQHRALARLRKSMPEEEVV